MRVSIYQINGIKIYVQTEVNADNVVIGDTFTRVNAIRCSEFLTV